MTTSGATLARVLASLPVVHVSLWQDTLGEASESDGPLPGPSAADVVIVAPGTPGCGPLCRSPTATGLRVVVLEAESIGFGASGRNGGWCSALMPMSLTALAERHAETRRSRCNERCTTP